MTIIDKALNSKDNRLGNSRYEIIDNYCPHDFDEKLSRMDHNTYEFKEDLDGYLEGGCRGITCDECWNKEID